MLRKLTSQSKYRHEVQQTVAHGPHLVESYLSKFKNAEMFYIATSAMDNQEVISLIKTLEARRITGIELPDSLYESLSDVHARVGISLVIPLPQQAMVEPVSHDAVLLETIQDPGNLGTILRTASAAGVTRAYLSSDCTSAWSPKALRAGMGAQFSMTLYEHVDLLSVTQQATVPTYATTLATDSISLYEVPLTSAVAWIFGSEGRGVSPELQSAASARVHIPQSIEAVESLNVAAAAAICLYERYRIRNS